MKKILMAFAMLLVAAPVYAEIDSNYAVGADVIVLKPKNLIEDVRVETRYDWEREDLLVAAVVTVDLTQLNSGPAEEAA